MCGSFVRTPASRTGSNDGTVGTTAPIAPPTYHHASARGELLDRGRARPSMTQSSRDRKAGRIAVRCAAYRRTRRNARRDGGRRSARQGEREAISADHHIAPRPQRPRRTTRPGANTPANDLPPTWWGTTVARRGPYSAFVVAAPLIGERAATRGRIATDGGGPNLPGPIRRI